MPKSAPWYPHKELTYGNLFFFIRLKTYSISPFSKDSIAESKSLILQEARKASPNYKMFIKAAKLATGLSERTIKQLLYTKETK
jgi:hypothetical protein